MRILSVLLFALIVNLDNFTVAVTYGIQKIKIGKSGNLLIAVISGAGTLLSMAAGLLISRFLPVWAANAVGSILLIGLGLWFLKDYFFQKSAAAEHPDGEKTSINNLLKEPEKADADRSGRIDLKECTVLAVALTLNNFGLGLGASITGLNLFVASACTFVFSILSVMAGYSVGKTWLSKFLGRYASLVSGLIVILLGALDLFF